MSIVIQAPPTEALVAAARDLAARLQITPRWQERLTPEARRLVEAVLEHDATTRGAVTCVACGAEYPNHLSSCAFIRPVRNEQGASA